MDSRGKMLVITKEDEIGLNRTDGGEKVLRVSQERMEVRKGFLKLC